jgi:hypothetical protein
MNRLAPGSSSLSTLFESGQPSRRSDDGGPWTTSLSPAISARREHVEAVPPKSDDRQPDDIGSACQAGPAGGPDLPRPNPVAAGAFLPHPLGRESFAVSGPLALVGPASDPIAVRRPTDLAPRCFQRRPRDPSPGGSLGSLRPGSQRTSTFKSVPMLGTPTRRPSGPRPEGRAFRVHSRLSRYPMPGSVSSTARRAASRSSLCNRCVL